MDDNYNFKVFDVAARRVITSHDVAFQETTFPFKSDPQINPIILPSSGDESIQEDTPVTINTPQSDEDDDMPLEPTSTPLPGTSAPQADEQCSDGIPPL